MATHSRQAAGMGRGLAFLNAALALTALLFSTAPVHAVTIDFDDKPISFSPPSVKDDKGGVTTNSTLPTKFKRADGYEIQKLSYTTTATAPLAQSTTRWTSAREFNLAGGPKDPGPATLSVSIFGNTDVTLSGGSAILTITGTLDGEVVVTFTSGVLKAGAAQPVVWNKSGDKENVFLGNHALDMESTLVWDPAVAGDTITVSSIYGVTAAVPEPATWLLSLAGFVGLALRGRCRKSQA